MPSQQWWEPALDEVESFTSVSAEQTSTCCLASAWRFVGPGIMVAIAYIDPGNYATDLSGGSRFQYQLLWSILFAHLVGYTFQVLVLYLSLATGRNLSEECALEYPRLKVLLWLIAEVSSVASDLGYVMGTATAFKIFFNMPLQWAVLLSACDTLVFMAIQAMGHRKMELLCAILGAVVVVCCVSELILARPPWSALLGYIPMSTGLPEGKRDATDYIVITTSIIGASVCPPNFYLHSALVRTRRFHPASIQAERTKQLQTGTRYNAIETAVGIFFAFSINSIILVIVGQKYYNSNNPQQIDNLGLMADFLELSIGPASKILFGLAILFGGQAASVTGTLASQFILEGFMHVRLKMWIRRLANRLVSVIPAFFMTLAWGDKSASIIDGAQIVVNFAVPFTLIPILKFVASQNKMSCQQISVPSSVLLWAMTAVVIGLNLASAIQTARDAGPTAMGLVFLVMVPYIAVLVYMTLKKPTHVPDADGLAAVMSTLPFMES
eukprot:1482467-Amphidinium_carterae.1